MLAQALQTQITQAVSLVLLRLLGSSPRPQGEITSQEYQSIDMGPDSLSEQNTEAASLLSPQHRTLTAASGLHFPDSIGLSLGSGYRVFIQPELGGVDRECVSGRVGDRQKDKWRTGGKAAMPPAALLRLLLTKLHFSSCL